jgi:hypothetical protein
MEIDRAKVGSTAAARVEGRKERGDSQGWMDGRSVDSSSAVTILVRSFKFFCEFKELQHIAKKKLLHLLSPSRYLPRTPIDPAAQQLQPSRLPKSPTPNPQIESVEIHFRVPRLSVEIPVKNCWFVRMYQYS